MPLDGFSTAKLCLEINTKLQGGRIDKVYQPDNFTIILQLRNNNRNYRLCLSCSPQNPYLALTARTFDNPKQAPGFCMFLRKHLTSARIIQINSLGYERQITLAVSQLNELGDQVVKYLILELMGRHSNLILVNQNMIILDSMIHVDSQMSSRREVLPAHPYQLPPAQDHKLSFAEFTDTFLNKTFDELDAEVKNLTWFNFLQTYVQGLSGLMIEGILSCLDQNPQASLQEGFNTTAPRLAQYLQEIDNYIQPSIYQHKKSGRFDFHSISFNLTNYSTQPVEDLSAAIDYVAAYNSNLASFQNQKHQLELACRSRLKVLNKKLKIHLADIKNAGDFEMQKIYADLITANIYRIKPNDDFLHTINFYDENQSEIEIPLFTNRTASQAAQIYYKRYTKNKTKLQMANDLKQQTSDELDYLNSLLTLISNSDNQEDLELVREELTKAELIKSRSKKSKDISANHQPNLHPGKPGSKQNKRFKANSKPKAVKTKETPTASPFSFEFKNGLRIMVGRNNLQNDKISLGIAKKSDLWFHKKNAPGAHVILQLNNHSGADHGTMLDDYINIAAGLCAWYSIDKQTRQQMDFAGDNNNLKIDIDYCPAANLRKPKGAKPGYVIYDNYKTLTINPLNPQDLNDALISPDYSDN